MASIAMNKLKSKLTTRNQFTGKALDRMTKENLRELFQGDLNYMSWEKTYLQRRFHPDEYLTQIREHRREIFAKQRANSTNSHINYDEILAEEEKHDLELQQRFKKFSQTHNGTQAVLILDVDNTMVYVRFFSEEMQIGDIVTYFASESVTKNNGKVIEIRLTLSLDVSHNTLIDKLGSERMICQYWATSNELLKKYKKKNGVFDYALDETQTIGCKIRKVEVTGCKIYMQDHNENDTENTIEIDFTNGNENLSKLEPMLERPGMTAVDFIYEGFLIRLRPNLDEFLEYCADDYDVVIYTSANKLIYEGMLEVLHEYVKDQLGRADEEELLLWSDVLYRDDCTLDYNERGKPYHHKDLTLFGCDLSRVIMIDNSPIVCRGEEPNFILIRDYFGKDNMDDELMEVYQMLDAMVDIQGDVRYFLCGLDSEQSTCTIDLCTEESCWNLTETLMQQLDAYYSEQIALSPMSSGYLTEEDEVFMDDYDEEDIPDREKIISFNTTVVNKPINDNNNIQNVQDTYEHDMESTPEDVLILTPDTTANKSPQSEKKNFPSVSYNPISEPNSPKTLHLAAESSVSVLTDTGTVTETQTHTKNVKFAAPSLNTKNRDISLSLSQSNRTQSAKKIRKCSDYTVRGGRGGYKNNTQTQSARYKVTKPFHNTFSSGSQNMALHMKRNKSLLLDPQKLDAMTRRHARYSSMSPRYMFPSVSTNSDKLSKNKMSFNDLSINDAIHSFGAVDTDDEDDVKDEKHKNTFFSAKQLHEHTKSSLTIDSKRYSLQKKSTQKVPVFNMIASQSADAVHITRDSGIIININEEKEHKKDIIKEEEEEEFLDHDFIPPPNFNKRKSMKTVDRIKAEKHLLKQKRLSEKRNSSMLLKVQALDIFKKKVGRNSLQKKKGVHHRRGLSSDAIGQIDFEYPAENKIKPGKKKHKMSIQDAQQFGKVWRNTINTMAPRPTAQKIVSGSKHDEFILLFQQQLNEIKQAQIDQYKRKQTHENAMEKRKSVPDFAMLSEIDSETDIIAHKLRLSTLREECITNLTFRSNTLQSVNEKRVHVVVSVSDEKTQKLLDGDGDDGTEIVVDETGMVDVDVDVDGSDDFDKFNSNFEEIKLIQDWDKSISTKHGCCYYFCCCCICNLFSTRKYVNDNNPVSYSPHSPR